jgi:DNA-binding MarR family transcriptional regulator
MAAGIRKEKSLGKDMKPIARKEVAQKTATRATLTVLRLLGDGFTQKQIAGKLKIHKSRVSRIVKNLQKTGFLTQTCRSNINTYRLTPKGKTAIKTKQVAISPYTTDGGTKLHGLQISVPVPLPANLDGFWDKSYRVNKNLWERVKAIDDLNLTIREKSSKHKTTIYIQTNRNMAYEGSVREIAKEIVMDVYDYLLRVGYLIDRKRLIINDFHLWSGSAEDSKDASDYPHHVVLLGRKRAKITPNDPTQPAKAWTDSTPTLGTDTNWEEYYRKKTMMPEYVHEILDHVRDLKNHTFGSLLNRQHGEIVPADNWNPAQTTQEMVQGLMDFGEAFE